jgi:hypothetical protein
MDKCIPISTDLNKRARSLVSFTSPEQAQPGKGAGLFSHSSKQIYAALSGFRRASKPHFSR